MNWAKCCDDKRTLSKQHRPLWVGHLLNNLGEVARQRGDYVAAIPFYQEALVIAEQIGNREGEAVYRCNLGAARLRLGEYQAAESELRNSIAVSSTGYWVSEAYCFLAEACLRQARIDQALEAARHSLNVGRETGSREAIGMEAEQALTLREWGRHAMQTRDRSRGQQLMQSARHIFVRLGMNLEVTRLEELMRYEGLI